MTVKPYKRYNQTFFFIAILLIVIMNLDHRVLDAS